MDNSNHEEDKPAVYISYDNNDSSISSFIKFLTATFNHHGVYQPVEETHRLSMVLVVVFSRNYTFSLPNNLVSRLNNKDRVVVPVLYGVTVSFVKEQIPVLEPWPRALLESVVFPGHVYNEEQSEFKFMEEIARDVFEKLHPTKEIGIHRLLLNIENLLCKQPWGVRSLGISGEPGIGKRTLAKALFRRMSSGYDASCFIDNFHEEYNEKRLQHLSDEYRDEIPMEEIKFSLIKSISTPSHRKKRVLIALDDVQNDNDVKSFLGDEFGPGSLIILTSRHKKVLEKCEVNEIYELQGLNQEDAMKLFTRCAFGKDVTEQNLLKCSTKEIEDANGSPLTICANATRRKNELSLLNSHEVMSSNRQESSRCDIENNTSMRSIPNEEEDKPGVNIELPSFHDNRLVRFLKDFVNSISQIIMLMKNTVSINKSYFIYIMVSVFGCLWYFLGYWEGSEFFKQTIIFLVLVNYTVIFFL